MILAILTMEAYIRIIYLYTYTGLYTHMCVCIYMYTHYGGLVKLITGAVAGAQRVRSGSTWPPNCPGTDAEVVAAACSGLAAMDREAFGVLGASYEGSYGRLKDGCGSLLFAAVAFSGKAPDSNMWLFPKGHSPIRRTS